jgi:imidazolonepropionase
MNGNLIIKNASEVVTCSGFTAKKGKEMSELGIIADGVVVIEQGKITRVGATAEVMAEFKAAGKDLSGFDTINATGKTVLAGFVDSHTHLVFGGYRADEYAWRLQGDSYMDILQRGGGILSTVRATRSASREELTEAGLKRLDSMLAFGVTTVEGKSGYGLDRETEIKQLEVMADLNRLHPLDVVPTFMGAHAVLPEHKGRADAYIDFLLKEVVPEVAARKPNCTRMRSSSWAARNSRRRSGRFRPITCCTPPTTGSMPWPGPVSSRPFCRPRPSASGSPMPAAGS